MELTLPTVMDLITRALEVEPGIIQESTRASEIEEWDSLGHISILSEIDKIFYNITEKCPSLASANSVQEIYESLCNSINS